MQKNTLFEQKNGLIALNVINDNNSSEKKNGLIACTVFLEKLINRGNFAVSNYNEY